MFQNHTRLKVATAADEYQHDAGDLYELLQLFVIELV